MMKYIVFLMGAIMSCQTLDNRLNNDELSTIASRGGNPALVETALAHPDNQFIDSILIYKSGDLVIERYAHGYEPNSKHDLRSATKSITGLLVGIALEKGLIKSINEPILDYFPEYAESAQTFGDITIENLLTMTSGLDADDWDPKSPGNEEKMYQTHSWVQFFFGLRKDQKPGTSFKYCTAGVIVLGEIVCRAAKMSFEDFAKINLFDPLDIRDFSYAKTPAGETDSGGHLELSPRDFAKIGLVYANQGRYEGKQIVSSDWIGQSLRPAILIPGFQASGPFMGHLWWLEPVVEGEVKSFQARGNGGQYIIAVPALDLLCVFTGQAFNDNRQMQAFRLMQEFIIPAFKQ